MKVFFIVISFTFFLSLLAEAQPKDSIFVIISSDTVHIWDTGAYENCGCLFRMDVSISSDTIFVTEVDTTSDWAYCLCNFDLCASITGLQSGNYFVKVFRYMPLFYPDTVFYIGSTSYTYSGPVATFLVKGYQSDCYNITEVKESEVYPGEFKLEQNYPNPFNPSTKISYTIPSIGTSLMKFVHFVQLKVYDVLGNEVATLVDEYKQGGSYEVEFSAKDGLASGLYIYTLKAGDYFSSKKMIFLK